MPAQNPVTTSIPGPVPGSRLTPEYVRSIGSMAYVWGWPLVNMHNRRLILERLPEPGLMGGIVPVAPPNQLSMLRDYIDPGERLVACPNQDVVYGFGLFTLDHDPIVVQVPDFGDRFWVYQVVDQRTDSFVRLGKMYETKPGFYLLAGPDWKGAVPDGIAGVFRSKTNLGVIIPRVFMDDSEADRQAIQSVLTGILTYPLNKYTGKMQTKDWSKVPHFPAAAGNGDEETKWVEPEKFFDELSDVVHEVPPLPGEESLYALFQSVLDAAHPIRSCMRPWLPQPSTPIRKSSLPSFSSTTTVLHCPTIGRRRIMVRRLAPITSPAPQRPNRTSSSTRLAKPSTSIRILIAQAKP